MRPAYGPRRSRPWSFGYGLGDAAVVATVREHAARRDAEAMVRRAAEAVADRRVTTRPVSDTMAYLTALLRG